MSAAAASAPASSSMSAAAAADAGSVPAPAGTDPAPAGCGADAAAETGRLALETFNFGAPARDPELRSFVLHNLMKAPVIIMLGQEVDSSSREELVQAGWMCSEEYWTCKLQPTVGGNTRRVGAGLLVAAKPARASVVTSNAKLSFHGPGAGGWSQFQVATVHLRQPMAGFEEFTLVNVHLHPNAAKAGAAPNRKKAPTGAGTARNEFFDRLASAVLRSGARLLGGDFNMSLFETEELLRKRGVSARLVAHHFELSPAPAGSGEAEQLLYDSCGFFIVGPVAKVRQLDPVEHILAGARHPAPVGDRKGAKGFIAGSYSGEVPRIEVSADVLLQCQSAWASQGAPAPSNDEGSEPELVGEQRRIVVVPDPAPAGSGSSSMEPLQELSQVDEWLAQSDKFDDRGEVWPFRGHWPLFIAVGKNRTRSREATQRRTHIRYTRWCERSGRNRWRSSAPAGSGWGGGWDAEWWAGRPWSAAAASSTDAPARSRATPPTPPPAPWPIVMQ